MFKILQHFSFKLYPHVSYTENRFTLESVLRKNVYLTDKPCFVCSEIT